MGGHGAVGQGQGDAGQGQEKEGIEMVDLTNLHPEEYVKDTSKLPWGKIKECFYKLPVKIRFVILEVILQFPACRLFEF